MTLKRLLWILGFDYEELWPTSDTEDLHDRDKRRAEKLRRRCHTLLRLRRAIADLEQRIESSQHQAASLSARAASAAVENNGELNRTRQRVKRQRDLLELHQQRYQQGLARIRRLHSVSCRHADISANT
jgi:uncharacterized protein YoxC